MRIVRTQLPFACKEIVAHLSERFHDLEETDELEVLRSLKWLPARRDRKQWYAPSSLYAPFRSYLFESQGRILDVPSPNSDFLVFLGVRLEARANPRSSTSSPLR